MELAEYIKNIRKENSLTQKEFSDKLGMSLSTIKKIETGETRELSNKVLKALGTFLNKPTAAIFAEYFFPYEEIVKEDSYDLDDFEFARRLFAKLLLDGHGVTSFLLNKDKFKEYNGFRYASCLMIEMYLKKAPTTNVIVARGSRYLRDELSYDNEEDVERVRNNIIFSVVSYPDRMNRLLVVFDATSENEVQWYNALKNSKVFNLKTYIYVGLFDWKTCEMESSYRFFERRIGKKYKTQ